MFVTRYLRLLAEARAMPRVRVNLMFHRTQENDPFFARVVSDFYAQATARRPSLPLVRRMSHGVALCRLPDTFERYFMSVEGSARRNYKKACRTGCRVVRIQFNDHLDAIRDVRLSTPLRQGRPMPDDYSNGIVRPVSDPPSRNPCHDFPYFGVFAGDTLIGYAGCLVAGELCHIEHILGHAEYANLGAVPLLIIGIAKELYRSHAHVKYFAYGTYFGAGPTMRRFKRKFRFMPHRVDWELGALPGTAPPQMEFSKTVSLSLASERN
jgi:hypothetical protein